MKPRRTAALALVGWYLIFPPLTPNGRWINPTAPLSQWYKATPQYASKDDCESARTKLIALHLATPSTASEQLRFNGEEASRYVPSDDPRLYGDD